MRQSSDQRRNKFPHTILTLSKTYLSGTGVCTSLSEEKSIREVIPEKGKGKYDKITQFP